MAWKPWNELSPDYKKRLMRKGITAKEHRRAKNVKSPVYRSLKAERGKGEHTPAEMKRKAARTQRTLDTITAQKLRDRGWDSHIQPDVIDNAISHYGLDFVRILLAYKEYRHNLYVTHNHKKGIAPTIDNIGKWAKKQGYKWPDKYDTYVDTFDYRHPLIRYQ